MTQTLGVHINYPPAQKHEKKLSYEKGVMNELIKQLPRFDKFSQNFNHKIQNWLPFYWNGFEQTTRYTYVIDHLEDLDAIFTNFNRAKKKNIKRAEKIVNINYNLSPEEFYINHKLTLEKQNNSILYDFVTFKSIHDATTLNNSSVIISATDELGNLHGALFIIWDSRSAYDLISTIDPDFRDSGAASLLVKKAIEYVSRYTNRFDFEGSMIENVETSFRMFGAHQTPYHKIYKYPSRILKVSSIINQLFKQNI